MDIAILFGLILLNGFFAMSEISLVAARKARLQNLAQQGDKAAATALRLGEDPTFFLSAVQIGITSIGVLNGIVGVCNAHRSAHGYKLLVCKLILQTP